MFLHKISTFSIYLHNLIPTKRPACTNTQLPKEFPVVTLSYKGS